MKPERFLVTTSVKGRSRKVIWDATEPMSLDHPKSWVLERTNQGIHVKAKQKTVEITSDIIEKGSIVILPVPQREDRKINLKVQRVAPIRAAYLPAQSSKAGAVEATGSQYFASFGVRKYLLDYQPFRDAFVGYVRRQPVFAFIRTPEGNKLKPLLEDVRIKFKGEAGQPLEVGQAVPISDSQLANAMIIRGTHWWRIHHVDVPQGLTPEEMAQRVLDEEEGFFKKLLKGAAVLLLLLMLVFLLWPKPEEKPEEKPLPPEVTKVILKKPKVNRIQKEQNKGIPNEDVGVKSVATDENKPIPSPPKNDQKKDTPAPPAAKQAVKQPEQKPEDVAAARAAKQAAQQEAQRAAAAKAAAARAKMLKDSLSGALKAGAFTSPKGTAGMASNEGKDLFEGKGDEHAPTVVKPGYAVKSTGVQTIGGGSTSGKGDGSSVVSYGSGNRGKINGRGGSLVQVDQGGSSVDTGLTKDEVGAVIHKHMAEVRYCYDAATLRRPGLEGKLVLQFTIVANGRVKSPSVESSSVNDRILEQCVIGKLVNWQFPRTRGGVEVGVSYPFLFKLLGKE